jgi:hypothetical protein
VVFEKLTIYNEEGNTTKEIENDVTSNRILVREYDYDKHGDLLRFEMYRPSEYRIKDIYSYDEKGNIINKVTTQNTTGGENVENEDIVTYDYSKKGHLLSESLEHFYYGYDGTEFSMDFVSYSYVFDKRGNVVAKVKEYDRDFQPEQQTIDTIEQWDYKYNKKGIMIAKIYEMDHEANGIVDYTIIKEIVDQSSVLCDLIVS